MNSTTKLLVLFTALSLVTCRPVPPASTGIGSTVQKELGADVEEVANGSGKYVLFRQKATPGQMLRFVVIESATSKVVERGSFMPGYVKWKDDTTLEVLSVPGTLREGEDLSRYIRVIRINTTP
jgi:hypothetical protein